MTTNDIFGGQYTSITPNVGSTTFNPNAPLFGTTNSASTASTTNTASTASTSTSATNTFKNDASGLNDLLNLGSQAVQIGGSIKYQRQQSGASANRQARIAQCGRKPLLGKAKKEAYQKCIDDANKPLPTDLGGGNDNKNLGGGEGSSMKFVWIGLVIAVAGGIGYMLYKKSK
jgi:hypothetical protein